LTPSGRPGLVFDIGGKTSLMLLPLFVALFQTVADGQVPSRDARPVRVWLGSSGVLTRGTPVRVYVQAGQDGNLIVLHRRTDGRIEVLFPGKPNEDPFVRAGTYEIQATPSRVAFVVAEPDGSGLVLAALAPRDYRFDEFVRAAAWDPDALAPSWDGSDGEGVLSDIVQRMLGDGYFNYDIAAYTVAPPVYAMQPDTGAQYPMYPTCTDCAFIGFQQNRSVLLALHRRRAVPPSRAASRRGANRRADPDDRALDAGIVRNGRDSARREGRGWGWDRVRAQDADCRYPPDRTPRAGTARSPT